MKFLLQYLYLHGFFLKKHNSYLKNFNRMNCFIYTKFKENRKKIETMKRLPFFRQYGHHDVILAAKSLKTHIHTITYLGNYLMKVLLKSAVNFDHTACEKKRVRHILALVTIFKIRKKTFLILNFERSGWRRTAKLKFNLLFVRLHIFQVFFQVFFKFFSFFKSAAMTSFFRQITQN